MVAITFGQGTYCMCSFGWAGNGMDYFKEASIFPSNKSDFLCFKR